MAQKRKICIITGSRAEYGLLSVVMEEIKNDPAFILQLVATGMHLSPEFGLTYTAIERDGFRIDAKVEMLLSSDSPVGIAKSISLGISGFADAFSRLQPDLVLLLGDRFEIFAAAQAALVAKIPIAHIAGGDTTEGAFDEAIRHSITKMSHIHFVTNEQSALRVKQLGENPSYIFNVGSPGIDVISRISLLKRHELEKELSFSFLRKNILATFHPATLDSVPAEKQFAELLKAFDLLGSEVGIIITKPNADTNGRSLIRMVDEYCASHPNAKSFTSLGQLRYLSAIAQVDAVVGNSSSGLYEVPSFKKPTVNIGDRQKGRLQAISVINCRPEFEEILRAIEAAFVLDCSNTINPYGNGRSAVKMTKILRDTRDYSSLLQKHFFGSI